MFIRVLVHHCFFVLPSNCVLYPTALNNPFVYSSINVSHVHVFTCPFVYSSKTVTYVHVIIILNKSFNYPEIHPIYMLSPDPLFSHPYHLQPFTSPFVDSSIHKFHVCYHRLIYTYIHCTCIHRSFCYISCSCIYHSLLFTYPWLRLM